MSGFEAEQILLMKKWKNNPFIFLFRSNCFHSSLNLLAAYVQFFYQWGGRVQSYGQLALVTRKVRKCSLQESFETGKGLELLISKHRC